MNYAEWENGVQKTKLMVSHTIELISRLFLAVPEVLPPRAGEALLSLKLPTKKNFA